MGHPAPRQKILESPKHVDKELKLHLFQENVHIELVGALVKLAHQMFFRPSCPKMKCSIHDALPFTVFT